MSPLMLNSAVSTSVRMVLSPWSILISVTVGSPWLMEKVSLRVNISSAAEKSAAEMSSVCAISLIAAHPLCRSSSIALVSVAMIIQF